MPQCTINGKRIDFQRGDSVLKIISASLDESGQFLICKVNNRLFDLHYRAQSGDRIHLLDIGKQEGYRCYQNSLSFLLSAVVREIFPKRDLIIEHSFGDGFYCKFARGKSASKSGVARIKRRMKEYVAGSLTFESMRTKKASLLQIFAKRKLPAKAQLLRSQRGPKIWTYQCAQYTDITFTPLVPNTAYLALFDLRFYKPGFVLRFPSAPRQKSMPRFPNPRKLFKVFQEYEQWGEIIGVSDINSLNRRIELGEISDVIKIAEALHEKRIARIADEVRRQEKLRIILIAGPSASGKTTFSKRLGIQLRVNCLNPIAVSIDNYFKERDDTPRLPDGSYDFESIHAIDVDLLNRHLVKLLQGRHVRIPEFDFTTGKRKQGDTIQMNRSQILIMEGIHGLNEQLTHQISRAQKLKIYISALTQLNIDNDHRISTRDTRILRRMVRDSLFRGHSANETFKLWKNVQKGEDINIFPFQEEADVMFNSALVYELSVLKRFAIPLLRSVSQKSRNYSKANRLLQVLSFFGDTTPSEVPPTSILREFIGGSSFLY